MKKHILIPYLFIFSLLISFTACKKSATTDNNTDIATHADDESQVSSDVDAVANDADVALESNTSFTGRYEGTQGVICNGTLVLDTTGTQRTLTITYSGTNCLGNLSLTGVVVISMPQGVRWKNAGAAVTVAFQNLKITRILTNKSITINGSKTYTNVSGGLLINLPTLGTVTHAITSSGLSITFDNGSQRSWQIARQRVYSFTGGTVVLTTTGTHTDGSTTGISDWGTNRFGNAFTTSITEPLVVRQDCNGRLTSGTVKHVTPAVTATVTFGLDASGNPTSCPGTGHYYYKVVWIGPGGNSHTIINPY